MRVSLYDLQVRLVMPLSALPCCLKASMFRGEGG